MNRASSELRQLAPVCTGLRAHALVCDLWTLGCKGMSCQSLWDEMGASSHPALGTLNQALCSQKSLERKEIFFSCESSSAPFVCQRAAQQEHPKPEAQLQTSCSPAVLLGTGSTRFRCHPLAARAGPVTQGTHEVPITPSRSAGLVQAYCKQGRSCSAVCLFLSVLVLSECLMLLPLCPQLSPELGNFPCSCQACPRLQSLTSLY